LGTNCLPEQVIEGKTEERIEVMGRRRGKDLSSYCIILRKRQDPGNWNRRHKIALCGELSLEEDLGLS